MWLFLLLRAQVKVLIILLSIETQSRYISGLIGIKFRCHASRAIVLAFSNLVNRSCWFIVISKRACLAILKTTFVKAILFEISRHYSLKILSFPFASKMSFLVRRKVYSIINFALDNCSAVTILLSSILGTIDGRCSSVDFAMLKCQVSFKGWNIVS